MSTSSASDSPNRESRRQLRYSQAEEALIMSFQSHIRTTSLAAPSSAPIEIQLRLLHQAAEFLTTQAAEARERSLILSTDVLKDRANVDPDRYSQALVQRWKEERRLQKIEEEARRLEAVILSVASTESLPSIGLDQPTETIAQKNLIKFLQTTSCSPRAHTRLRPRNYVTPIDHTPRRMTLADVSPFRARPWSVTEAFIESVRGHTRTKSTSTDGINVSSTNTTTSSLTHRKKPVLALRSPSLRITAEDPLVLLIGKESVETDKGIVTEKDEYTPSSTTTSMFSHTESVEVKTPTTELGEPNTPRLSTHSSSRPTSSAKEQPTNGTATIFQYSYLRSSPNEIEVEIELPSYAHDLFAGFDRAGLESSLVRGEASYLPLRPVTLSSSPTVGPVSSTPTTGFFSETSSQVRKRLQRVSMPAVPSPSPRLSLSSASPPNNSLKPRSSLGSLHPNAALSAIRTSNGKTPQERKWGSLLSIPESSSSGGDRSRSLLSLSMSGSGSSLGTSLAPPARMGSDASRKGKEILNTSTKTESIQTLLPLTPSLNLGSEGFNSEQENAAVSSTLRTTTTALKHKLSFKLSSTIFGSPTKRR